MLGPIAGKLAKSGAAADCRSSPPAPSSTCRSRRCRCPAGRRRRRSPLVAAHEIVTLPSASSLALLRREGAQRPPARKTIAIFADPVFTADDPRVGKAVRDRRPRPPATSSATMSAAARPDAANGAEATLRPPATLGLEPFLARDGRPTLARLPFWRAEAVAATTQVSRALVLEATDFDASLDSATSERLTDYRIVHFATTVDINTTRPELSGLALSLVDSEGRSP